MLAIWISPLIRGAISRSLINIFSFAKRICEYGFLDNNCLETPLEDFLISACGSRLELIADAAGKLWDSVLSLLSSCTSFDVGRCLLLRVLRYTLVICICVDS